MHEQTRQQHTTTQARLGYDAILSDEVSAESACMVAEEKQETNQLKIYNENL